MNRACRRYLNGISVGRPVDGSVSYELGCGVLDARVYGMYLSIPRTANLVNLASCVNASVKSQRIPSVNGGESRTAEGSAVIRYRVDLSI